MFLRQVIRIAHDHFHLCSLNTKSFQWCTLYSANHKNNKTKSGKGKTILRESTHMYLKHQETLEATLTIQSNYLPATHPATRRRTDVVTTSLCMSQRRRSHVSNEIRNDVSVERRQDVSVVRLHDILLERRDDVSRRGNNDVPSVHLLDVSNKSQMKHPTTSQWYVTKTCQWYISLTSHQYLSTTSPVSPK